jgi:outer membrane protein
MKNLRITFLTVALLGAMTLAATAQTKIATVDMKKLFNGYWKTPQAQTALENRKLDLRKEIKEMADGLEKAQADYKLLLDQANDQVLSQDERDKRKQSAADKAKEINNSKIAIEQFQRQAESQLADQSQRMSGGLVTDIQKAIADQAKAGGYTLVFNSATSEMLVFSATNEDITIPVLKQLNAGKPIDVTKPFSGNDLPLTISTNLP